MKILYILQIHKVLISKCLWVIFLASQVEVRRKQEWTLVSEGEQQGWWAQLQQLLLLFGFMKGSCWWSLIEETRDFNALWSAKEKKKKDFNAPQTTSQKRGQLRDGWGAQTEEEELCFLVIPIDLVLNKHMLNGLFLWPLLLPGLFQLIYFPSKCYCIMWNTCFLLL